MVGMFQKEVAERVCSGNRTKKYGILSVLIQAFYNVEYLLLSTKMLLILLQRLNLV